MSEEPCKANHYLKEHTELLRHNHKRFTGVDLIDAALTPTEAAKALYHAPFALMSHNTAKDPIFNYCNLRAQQLFEMPWREYTSTLSQKSAEAINREERARLLAEVSKNNVIHNYAGVRVSKSGRRFQINQATVFNLFDDNENYQGQSATFSDVVFL